MFLKFTVHIRIKSQGKKLYSVAAELFYPSKLTKLSQPDAEPRKSQVNEPDTLKLEKLQSVIDQLKALVMIAKQKNEHTIDVSLEKTSCDSTILATCA